MLVGVLIQIITMEKKFDTLVHGVRWVNAMTKTMTTTTNTTTNSKKLNLLNYSRYSTYPYSSREEWSNVHHATAYLDIVDAVPHRTEGETILLEHIPINAKRVLDLGTGNGRLLKMIKANRPNIKGVGLDISPTMLRVAQESFVVDKSVKVIEHDLNNSLLLLLSKLGTFDVDKLNHTSLDP
jgi:SAM-dependent methyltransferase